MMQLKQGECLELMKKLPDNSINLILCDLPYGVTECKWDSVIPFNLLWEQYKRVTRKGGTIVLFAAQPFTTNLIHSNMKDFKYLWYWKKNYATGHAFSKYQPMRCIEDICVFVNDKGNVGKHAELRKYFFDELNKSGMKRKDIDRLLNCQMSSHYFTMGQQFSIPSKENYLKLQTTGFFKKPYEEIKEQFRKECKEDKEKYTYNPQGVTLKKNPKKRAKKNNSNIYSQTLNNEYTEKYENFPKNLLDFPSVPTNGRLHPTQKPVELLEYLIKTYTNKGDTVLDNCMGSGSTGVACVNTERNFIGFELNKKYFETAKKRIEDTQIK